LIVTFLACLMTAQPLELYEDGQMQRDFVHVRDVVDATLVAAERPEAIGRVVNVGSGEGVTVAQVADALIEIVGASAPPRQVSVARVGDVRHVVADIRRAREILGYVPRVLLREGLTELVEWFRHQDGLVDRSFQARLELERQNLLR
jgi:dTDP-L-rhamnose 4-epimerase